MQKILDLAASRIAGARGCTPSATSRRGAPAWMATCATIKGPVSSGAQKKFDLSIANVRGEVWGSKEAIGRHSHGLLPHGKSRPLFPRPTRPRQPSPRWGGRPGGRPRRYHLPGGSRRKGRASPPVLPTGSVVAAADRRRISHVRSLRGTGRAGGRDRASGRGSVSRPAGDCTERISTSTARSHHREGRQGDGALGAARQLSSRLAAPSTGRCLPAIAGAAACRDGDDAGAQVRLSHEALLTHWPRARDQFTADARDLELRGRLEQEAELWRAASRRDKAGRVRASGLPLAEALALCARWRADLPPAITEFVVASRRVARCRRIQPPARD